MPSRMPYHFRYHDDALRGYFNLTLEERGVYTTLLDLMYSHQGWVEDHERRIAAELDISTRKYRSIRDSLINKNKIFAPAKGFLFNRRVQKEIDARSNRAVRAKLNGERRGRKSREIEELRNVIKLPR